MANGDVIYWIFIPAAIVFAAALVVREVGARLGWWGRRKAAAKADDVPRCPLCGKPTTQWARMPDLTALPNEFTFPWFKIIRHWQIQEAKTLACTSCADLAWSAARQKKQDVHTQQASHKKSIVRELADFQAEILTPLKDRPRNGK